MSFSRTVRNSRHLRGRAWVWAEADETRPSRELQQQSGSRSIDLNEEVEEEPPTTISRCPRPQGQQSTIRDARASCVSAVASGSRLGLSAPVSVLNRNLDLQMMKQLAENARAYESATDPITKRVYF